MPATPSGRDERGLSVVAGCHPLVPHTGALCPVRDPRCGDGGDLGRHSPEAGIRHREGEQLGALRLPPRDWAALCLLAVTNWAVDAVCLAAAVGAPVRGPVCCRPT